MNSFDKFLFFSIEKNIGFVQMNSRDTSAVVWEGARCVPRCPSLSGVDSEEGRGIGARLVDSEEKNRVTAARWGSRRPTCGP